MKRKLCLLFLLILGIFLTGCGKEESEAAEYRDIIVKREAFPDFVKDLNADGKEHYGVRLLGTQFLGEEPVQLWAEQDKEEMQYLVMLMEEKGLNWSTVNSDIYTELDTREDLGKASVYLWRMDGQREVLLEEIPRIFASEYRWYISQDGCFYLTPYSSSASAVRKLDSQGSELFRMDDLVFDTWDIDGLCQAPNHKIYLLLSELGTSYRLAEMDSDTGAVTILDNVNLTYVDEYQRYQLGVGMEGPALSTWSGISEVDLKEGGRKNELVFTGTSYTQAGGGESSDYEELVGFRIPGEGHAEILRVTDSGKAYVEQLSLETIQRIPVVLCAPKVSHWYKQQISRFNQENDTYNIVIEELGDNNYASPQQYQEALQDYARRIAVQVMAGKGPDILIGADVLGGNVIDMIEKGVLEDLRPHMERTGLRQENYFPMVFDAWRQGNGIYGICAYIIDTRILLADRNIVGENLDIRELTETLLSYPENAIYLKDMNSQELLRLFLEGSESLWGMVDWESGTCDFSGPLFADLLEVAKRYGDAPNKSNFQRIAQRDYASNFLSMATPSERENWGIALTGWMFDDGIHAFADGSPVAINANSAQKEGAWEFLCFLLDDEPQSESIWKYPVKKDIFPEWVDRLLDNYTFPSRTYNANGVLIDTSSSFHYTNRGFNIAGEWTTFADYGDGDKGFIKNEKLSYFTQVLEEARPLPIRTSKILDIICEEAESYFSGSKSAEEVASVIENRVGVYLGEHRK